MQAIRSCLPEEVGNLHPYTSQPRGLYGASTEEGRDIRCRAILSTPEGASATPSMLISSRILPRKPKQRSWRQAVLKSIRHNTCCTFEQIPNLRSNKSSAKQRNTGSAIRTYWALLPTVLCPVDGQGDEIMLNLAKKFAVRKNRHRHLARGKSAIWSAVIFWPSSYIGVRVEISRKKGTKKFKKNI